MIEQLHKQFAAQSSKGELQKIRQQAWDAFIKMGLPDKKQEAFQYVPLREFYEKSFRAASNAVFSNEMLAAYILPECANSFLVFVNGAYQPELSQPPAKLLLLPLDAALTTYAAVLQNRLQACVQEEKDPFALLNLSLGAQGLFAYLPPKIKLSEPLQCIQLLTERGALAAPRLQLFVGKEAEINLISTFHPLEEGWLNSSLDLMLDAGAHVQATSLLMQESAVWFFESVRATLKQNSHFKNLSLTRGAQCHRQSYVVALAGENAEAELDGMALLQAQGNAHAHVLMDHQAPFTRSKQLFKGALDGTSQSSFEGKIFVREAAQKTEAYQLNNYLLLGQHAQAKSKPNLEIFADDVKASHGATFGQLEKSALFYLKTRGISEEVARRLLVSAFCQEVGSKIPLASVRAQFADELERFVR